MLPELGLNPQHWDDERLRALKISLNHTAKGAAATSEADTKTATVPVKKKTQILFFAMNNRTFFSAKQARNFSEVKKKSRLNKLVFTKKLRGENRFLTVKKGKYNFTYSRCFSAKYFAL